MERKLSIVLLAVAGAAVGCMAASVRWNVSPSVSPGLYRETTRTLERGDLVAVCLPEPVGRWARRRGYVRRGCCEGKTARLGKWIAGVEGDRVEVSDETITVAGRRLELSGRVGRDAAGRPVPRVSSGNYLLAPGEVWLHSGRHPRSLDSRVYGPLEVTRIRGVMEPLWVIPER